MKLDEFAFVNQQLAGMLQCGVPLEGALRQLCETMHRGRLRTELELVEQDLAEGLPLRQALSRRKLPPFYVAMVEVGVQSNNLPAVLTLLADYYQRANLTWTRLKGLMVYPVIVLGAAMVLSVGMAVMYGYVIDESGSSFFQEFSPGSRNAAPSAIRLAIQLWLPVALLVSAFSGTLAMLAVPGWRRALRWRLPAFKEARLSQLASAMALMLQNGCTLTQALELLKQIEVGSPVQKEIELWQARLAAGHKNFPELARGGTIVPPLFIWLVAGSGEDWISGFKHAAEIYSARALHRIEALLYAALPVSILGLGLLILSQAVPMVQIFVGFMNAVSSTVDLMGN
jgi:type II secretory pathway component PulF